MSGEGVTVLRAVKHKSIKKEIVFLSCVALCIAVVFYFSALTFGTYALDNWWNDEKHIVEIEKEKTKELQNYIDENRLSLGDMKKVDKWAYEQDIIFLKIFVDDHLVYDSLYGIIAKKGMAIPEGINAIEEQNINELQFSDGTAIAIFAGVENYEAYAALDMGVLCISFLIFVGILIFGISKKAQYVTEITNDIKELSVDLSHKVEVKGDDDLTYVAIGINKLRETVINKMENEKAAYKSNRDLVTSLAHDIRTPLTAIIAYLEISVEREDLDEETLKNIHICLDKSYRLKDITDELFDYFLLDSDEYQVIFEAVNGNELVGQFFEEHIYKYQCEGVKIRRNISEVGSKLKVNVNLLGRFFDNVFSNINKYADLSKGLDVTYGIKDNYLFIGIKNYKIPNPKAINSSKIGLKNCNAIAEIHNGFADIKNSEKIFEIVLYLPIDKIV